MEKFAAAPGSSTIEPERKLVEIVIQMLMADRALVSAHQPAFQQGDHKMDPRHQLRGCFLLPLEERHFVFVAVASQRQIPQPARAAECAGWPVRSSFRAPHRRWPTVRYRRGYSVVGSGAVDSGRAGALRWPESG